MLKTHTEKGREDCFKHSFFFFILCSLINTFSIKTSPPLAPWGLLIWWGWVVGEEEEKWLEISGFDQCNMLGAERKVKRKWLIPPEKQAGGWGRERLPYETPTHGSADKSGVGRVFSPLNPFSGFHLQTHFLKSKDLSSAPAPWVLGGLFLFAH